MRRHKYGARKKLVPAELAGLAALSAAIRLARGVRGWNQKQLAAAAGVDKSRISLLEAGKVMPPEDEIDRLAAALGLPGPLFRRLLPLAERLLRAMEGKVPEEAAGLDAALAAAAQAGRGAELAAELAFLEVFAQAASLDPPEGSAEREEDRPSVAELWEVFAALPETAWKLVIEEGREYQTAEFLDRLHEEGTRAGGTERAVKLAEAAAIVSRLAEATTTAS